MENWQSLIKIAEKYEEGSAFVAECIYAYLANYSFETQKDAEFMNDLCEFIKGVSVCSGQEF